MSTRITIEVDSDGTVTTKKPNIFSKRSGAKLRGFTFITEVPPLIIYTPVVLDANGAHPAMPVYTVHQLTCQDPTSGLAYVIPYVEIGDAVENPPTSQTQNQYLTTGVLSAGESNTNRWYQTMKLTQPDPFDPIEHRLFVPFLKPPLPTGNTVNGIPNVPPFSPVTSNGCISVSDYPDDTSPPILFAWRTYNGVNIFLQQPTF